MENGTTGCIGNVTFGGRKMETDGAPSHFHHTPEGQAVIVLLSLQSLLIIFANSIVFALFANTRYLRTKTNYCLVSLAASDFLAGLVSLPLVLACSATPLPELRISMDLCQRFLSISTILHLLVATSERYIKITRPFKYHAVVTKRRVVMLLISVWTFSCCASFIQLTWINIRGDPETEKIKNFDVAYAIFCLAVLAFLPFLVIVCIDGVIFHFIHKEKKMQSALTQGKLLRKTEKQHKKKRNDRKAAVLYGIMTIAFVLGWFPYFIITLLGDLGHIHIPFAVSTITLVLKFSTALINPLLYTFFKSDFRKAFQGMMARQNRLRHGSEMIITTTVV